MEQQYSLSFKFPLAHGLHARPASFLQQHARKYSANIMLNNLRTESIVDAKSVVALMSSNTMHNDDCVLTFAGSDANDAYTWFIKYIQHEFPRVDDDNKTVVEEKVSQRKLPRVLANATIYRGISVATGAALAKVMLLESNPWQAINNILPSGDDKLRLTQALAQLKQQLQQQVEQGLLANARAIINAHIALLEDPDFVKQIHATLQADTSAAQALYNCFVHYQQLFGNAPSAYLRQRVIDIQDLIIQLINLIYHNIIQTEVKLTGPTILLAEELTPSQFLGLNRELLSGLVLLSASATSHTAILARSFGIPTISDLGAKLELAKQEVIIDGTRGILVVNPSAEVSAWYQSEISYLAKQQAKNQQAASFPCQTSDGQSVEIMANVASELEVAAAVNNGALGVGLFRSEFLFMDRDNAPTEEEQYQSYRDAVEAANGHPVIVRTLDIGGDKPLSYLALGEEENPFLGYRAVRFYPEYLNLFKDQLRALLRASAHGQLWVMVPMISHLDEILWVKTQLTQLMEELSAAQIAFNSQLKLGIMVEVPSVAFAIRDFAKHVDFFSIGTNDLCQYFFAAERGNNKVAQLANPTHPAFLRLLNQVIGDAVACGKHIGMCGEMAGNSLYLPLLVAMKISELSMSAPMVAPLRAQLRTLDSQKCRELLAACMATTNADAVKKLLEEFNPNNQALNLLAPELIDLNASASSKSLAIKQITNLLASATRVKDADAVEEALWAREDTYATGIGYGIAIPHCKVAEVKHSSIALLRLATPIEWGSLDDQPVRFIISLAINNQSGQENEHLKIIAKLSRQLMKEEFRSALINAATAEEALALVQAVLV